MLKGIVFDLDGTLVESLPLTFLSFNAAFEAMSLPRHTNEQIAAHFGFGEREMFEQMLGEELADVAYGHMKNYFSANLTKVTLHAGVPELLDRLLRNEVPVSIFTGRSWGTTEVILNHHGLSSRFITVVASDHVKQPKPHPEGLLFAASRMQLHPSELLFVGDSGMDIRAAHAAGAEGVAAVWDSLADKIHLKEQKPHYWADHPDDVYRFWSSGRPI